MQQKIELQDYTLEMGINGIDGAWLQYCLKNKTHNDKNKVHISIQHDEDMIKKAQSLILPILAKYKVVIFKTVNPACRSSSRNYDGKEFCIYMQIWDKDSDESRQSYWICLLTEIEVVLEENGIAKHPKGALGDLLFPGSKGYVYYRNSQNFANNYISATVLQESGFTRKEACEISINDFFNQCTLGGNKITSTNANPARVLILKSATNTGELLDSELKQYILNTYQDQLARNEKVIQLITGTEGGDYCHNYGWICDKLFKTKSSEDKNYKAFSAAKIGQLNLIEPFKQYLNNAAEKMAKISSLLMKNGYQIDLEKLGSILPALYFNFYAILYLEYKGNYSNFTPQLNKADSEKLVNEIVRCSFRDSKKTAIDYEQPQYLYEMNTEDMELLLSYTEDRNKVTDALFKQKTDSVFIATEKVTATSRTNTLTIGENINQEAAINDIAGIPTYSNLSNDVKAELSISSRNKRLELGHITTEEYWTILSVSEKLKLLHNFKSEVKPISHIIFFKESKELSVVFKQFISIETEQTRLLFGNISVSEYWANISSEEQKKLQDKFEQENSKQSQHGL